MGKVTEKIAAVFKRRSRQYDLEDYLERQKKRGYVGALQEVDPTPMAPPIGYIKRESLFDTVREMVRSEALRQAAEESGLETFEEADDFDIPDDPIDPSSPYENDFDPDIREMLVEGSKSLKAKEAAKAKEAEPAARTAPDPQKSGAEAPAAKPGIPPADL